MSPYNTISKIAKGAAAILLLTAIQGCIKNDIPYPRIQPNFYQFEVEDQSQAAVIDSTTRQITVYLNESADIYNVKVSDYKISRGGELVDPELFDSPIDLSTPLKVNVKLYQEYTWTITAQQSITHIFTVAGQIGASIIDVPARRIIAYIPETADITKVKVTEIKLGGEKSTMTPDLNGEYVDFTDHVTVDVEEFGRTEQWSIYIQKTEASVTTVSVDAWTKVAWLYGQAEEGKDNGFEYRTIDSDEWIRVPEAWVTHNGGEFVGRLIHLQPETTYVARAYSNDEYGAELEFTTQTILEMPNSSFDHWWLDGKVWCPWAEGGTPYWDTGNKGATTLGSSNSFPTEDTSTGTGLAAQLETRFVGIGVIGKLAAGNIFVGSYVRTDGTNGVLSFGRPFDVRPTRLHGFLKYHSAPISSVTAGYEDLKGRPDTCTVWIALIDSDEPFEIRTNPKNPNLFDPDGDYVVAYGRVQYGYDIDNYIPFDIELKYKSTSRKPKYILCTASASKYGDFFTGGNGSVLYVDDFVLEYDY